MMIAPNLKRLSPLFFVLVTGCASYQERAEYDGCHKTIYDDKIRLGEVVESKIVGGGWDSKCHKDTVALEEKMHANAKERADQALEIEREKAREGVRANIFQSIATMEMADPVLDKQRRVQLVDSIFQYVENQSVMLEQQGMTPESRAERKVLELFEIYDLAKGQGNIDNPVVRDAVSHRAINEIVTLYNGGKEPQDNTLYRQEIDAQLSMRGTSIQMLEGQFRSSIILKPSSDGSIQVFIPQ